MSEYKNLELKTNVPCVVTFQYDECTEGKYPEPKEGQHDTWYRYSFIQNNVKDWGFFPSLTLHNILKHYKKGDIVSILKDEYEPNKIKWIVDPKNGTPKRHEDLPEKKETEKKTEPVVNSSMRETAFKEACKMFGLNDDYLTKDKLDRIAYNTEALLKILEGRHVVDDKDLPF